MYFLYFIPFREYRSKRELIKKNTQNTILILEILNTSCILCINKEADMQKQKYVAVSPHTYSIFRTISKHNKRTLKAQLELIAEEECKRQGIKIPAELEQE